MTGPVSESPVHPVQVAIYDLLTADSELQALVTGVFDQVPEAQAPPYVRIGDHLSIPDNAHGAFGRQITTNIHVWSRARGNVTGQEIAARIGELLDHQGAELEAFLVGHRVVSVRLEFDQALADPNPQVRHHIMRFRIITSQD